MNYTKGKWEIELVKSSNPKPESLVYARIKTGDKAHAYTGVYHNNGRIPASECLANAKLISKAPETHVALKKLMSLYLGVIEECLEKDKNFLESDNYADYKEAIKLNNELLGEYHPSKLNDL